MIKKKCEKYATVTLFVWLWQQALSAASNWPAFSGAEKNMKKNNAEGKHMQQRKEWPVNRKTRLSCQFPAKKMQRIKIVCYKKNIAAQNV